MWNKSIGFCQHFISQDEATTALFGLAPTATAIRQTSHQLNSYSPILELELIQASLTDPGDLMLDIEDHQRRFAQIEAATVQCIEQQQAPLMFGCSATDIPSMVGQLLAAYPELVVLQLDAHPRLQADSPEDDRTAMHRVLEHLKDPQRLIQYGIRSGSREEFTRAEQCKRCGPVHGLDYQRLTALRFHLEALHHSPLAIHISMEVFDPSLMPEAKKPEPGGIRFDEFVQILHMLKNCNQIVGGVVTGLDPSLEPSGISALLSAKVIRELALLIGRKEASE